MNKTTVEMTGHGRGGKPKAGFPPRPQPLEIAARFPHSHRRDEAVEKWKAKSRLPTFPRHDSPSLKLKRQKKGGPAAGRIAPASRLILYENQNLASGSFLNENMLGAAGADPASPSHTSASRPSGRPALWAEVPTASGNQGGARRAGISDASREPQQEEIILPACHRMPHGPP